MTGPPLTDQHWRGGYCLPRGDISARQLAELYELVAGLTAMADPAPASRVRAELDGLAALLELLPELAGP